MQIRKPIVAGRFYPVQHDSCIDEINMYLDEIVSDESLPEGIVAGIVPHAGWFFSGKLAAMVFSAIKQSCDKVDTFIIFGAAHRYFDDHLAVYDNGNWLTPVGEIAIDKELAGLILKSDEAVSDLQAHYSEHSIEVNVPFIQYLFPGAKILPILVPPTELAIKLAQIITEIVKKDESKKIICIGSTDLTHYGLCYDFTPMGLGDDALRWAHQENDKKFIDLAIKVEPKKLLISAAENYNACGPGAAAAAVAFAKGLGKTKGILLEQTNSNEVAKSKTGTKSQDSVGYAAIVF